MNKKIVLFLLFLVTLLTLTGCGEESTKTKIKENYKTYNQFEKVVLKDDSSWIVLEDLDEELLLIKTNKERQVTSEYIDVVVSEAEAKLKSELNESSLELRIPTSEDMKKYFQVDFSNVDSFDNAYGITLDTNAFYYTSDWEYSSFWVEKDNDYISCKSSRDQIRCSLDEIYPEKSWHVLYILQINKSSIEYNVEKK